MDVGNGESGGTFSDGMSLCGKRGGLLSGDDCRRGGLVRGDVFQRNVVVRELGGDVLVPESLSAKVTYGAICETGEAGVWIGCGLVKGGLCRGRNTRQASECPSRSLTHFQRVVGR